MTSDSARNNALLASLPVDSDGNYIPTPAEPGVARIDYATDNTGLQTGDIGQFGYTDDLSPVIGGYQTEATAGLVIKIVCNHEIIGTVLTGPDGHWSFTPPTPLEPNHEYIFTTIIQDSSTDTLLVSLPYRFYTTDVNGDLKPDVSVDKVMDDVKGANNATGALHHGDVTNDARPAMSGHATANARVNIYDNGELIGSTTATSKGAWSYTPGTLSDGDHYLSASVYTAAGESHRSASFGITVDTHTETPVITEVYDDKGIHTGPVALGGATDDSQPKVSGTAEAGSTVTVMVYSAMLNKTYTLGNVVADAHGHWSYQLHGSQDITNGLGDWTFTAQSVDVAGNRSQMSSGYIVETVASNADAGAPPAITGITDDVGLHTGNIPDGGKTDDTRPEVHGTGEPYSTVVLKMYGPGTGKTYTIASLNVGADGHWSYQFTGKQAMQSGNGGHNIFTATSVDADGHTITSDSYTVTLVGSNQDTDGPAVPTIDKYHDNAGASSGDFKSGTTTDDTTPTLYGHADAKSVVKIYEGSTLLGSVIADKDGEWNFTPSARSEGRHTFFATATDAAGHTSAHSGNFVVTIDVPDTTPPDAPVITEVYDDVGTHKGPVANGGKTDDREPLISGTAEADSTVTVKLTGPAGANYTLGTVIADHSGHWHYQMTDARAFGNKGNWTIVAQAKDAAGNTSAWSNHYVVNYVSAGKDDTSVPGTPTIDTYHDDVGPSKGDFKSGTTTDDSTPELKGHADASSIIKVYEGSTLLGSTTAHSDGSWSFTPSARSEGMHTFFATATNAAGHTSGHSGNFVINIDVPDTTPPDAPVIVNYYDDAGDDKGFDSNGGTTDDTTPTLNGQAEASSIVKVYEGSTLLGSTTAKADGSWSYTTPVRADGKHDFTATATDAAGNVSAHSGHFVINIEAADTTPPDAPVITEVYDDVGTQKGPVANHGKTDDSQPLISGTAEADSTVTVKLTGPAGANYTLGTVIADHSGHWHYQMTDARAFGNKGSWTIVAQAKDAAGNVSAWSHQYVVEFVGSNQDDTTPPGTPTITDYYDDVGDSKGNFKSGTTTDDTTPTLHGQAEAKSVVKIYDGSTLLGSTTADTDGKWSYTTPERSQGSHTFEVTATDAAGNVSGYSNDFDLTVKTGTLVTSFVETFDSGRADKYFTGGTSGIWTDDRYSSYGNMLHLDNNNSSGTKLQMRAPVSRLSFDIIDLDHDFSSHPEYLYVKYYDENGNLLASHTHSYLENRYGASESYTAPTGKSISYVTLKSVGDDVGWTYVDNIAGTYVTPQYLNLSASKLDAVTYEDPQSSTTKQSELLVPLEHSSNTSEHQATIDLSSTYQHQTLLTVDDILSQAQEDMFIQNGKQQLAIQGNPSDIVELKESTLIQNEWHHEGKTTVGGIIYDVYDASTNTKSDIELLVQQGVELKFVQEGSSVTEQADGHQNMTNGTQDLVRLTLNDIISEAHPNLFIQDGHQQLAVTGEQGDVVELKVEDLVHNTWQNTGAVTAGGIQYEVYQHTSSDVELLVQHGLELHQVA